MIEYMFCLMKKFFLLASIVFLFSSFSAQPINPSLPDEEEPDEIVLNGQTGEDPNSVNTCIVTAYKTSSHIYVYIANYTGSVSITITGIGNTINYGPAPLTTSPIELDISTLPIGIYHISISTNTSYQGVFCK